MADGHWLYAATLQAGDRLLNADGTWAKVLAAETVNEPLLAYNLTVEGFHTYFVATNEDAAPVWVHNECGKFTNATSLLRRTDLDDKARAELASALEFQRETGIELRWSPRDGPDGDFIDASGKLWDVMGTPRAYQYWNPTEFFASIDRHINKQGINTVLDLRGATTGQIDMILNYVAAKPSAIADAITFLN